MPTTEHRAGTIQGVRKNVRAIPESLEIKPLIADLEKTFCVRWEKGPARVRKWFDTDDWRLYRRNLLLFHERRKWHLLHRDPEDVVATFSATKWEGLRFASDFPGSSMRTMLEPVLKVRALLPLVTQESSSVCVRILNKDRKTVAFVYFNDHLTRESGAVFRSVTLKGVRGYDSSFNEVSDFFATCGVEGDVVFYSAFVQGLRSIGHEPLDYTSKFSVDLQPNMTARQAMVHIYRQLLQTMDHNEKGIVGDLDTEFLHDFRVAIRRTRSGLGQVKGVLPADVAEKMKEDFSWLGDITGPTRDLDVYLQDREKYMCRLPDQLRPHLRHFFIDLEERRDVEQKKLIGKLRSRQYRMVIDHLHEYLQGAELGEETNNSGRQVSRLAREIIFRKYKKILKSGGSIQHSSPDEALHRLRIQCKKLRYILEFFASLFPAGEIKQAVKQLKQLQDNLGTFNDLSVQQEMLRNYLAGLKPGSRKNQELAVAIGGLLTNLHHQQQSVRKGFASRFHRFSSKENQLLYAKLFK